MSAAWQGWMTQSHCTHNPEQSLSFRKEPDIALHTQNTEQGLMFRRKEPHRHGGKPWNSWKREGLNETDVVLHAIISCTAQVVDQR